MLDTPTVGAICLSLLLGGTTQQNLTSPASIGPETHPAHIAITEDLYLGHIESLVPFHQNGNRTQVFLAKVHNPRSGRNRTAIFKPRPFGDGDGWNRTPIEYVAYRLSRMLGMDYVPPVAYRHHINASGYYFAEGSLQFFCPDAHMLSSASESLWGIRKDLLLSDTRILDVLIQNSDRHMGNILRGQHWRDGQYRPILIDHAAGFRPGAYVKLSHDNAFRTGGVAVIREITWRQLNALSRENLREFREFLTRSERDAILRRRDGIIRHFADLLEKRGRNTVIIPD